MQQGGRQPGTSLQGTSIPAVQTPSKSGRKSFDKLADLTASERQSSTSSTREAKEELFKLKTAKAECCVLFPGGRTDAAGEIKECAYDQSENRP